MHAIGITVIQLLTRHVSHLDEIAGATDFIVQSHSCIACTSDFAQQVFNTDTIPDFSKMKRI